MKYFRKTDPDDMSQGDLSKRVRFLKREEGGRKVMCKVMDELLEKERRGGVVSTKIHTAHNMFKLGMPTETIAKVLEESTSVVEQWLKLCPLAQ